MPNVQITVTERVTYSREVSMTDAEWHELDRATDQRGTPGKRAIADMVEKHINRARDWQDADPPELMDLSLVLED